MEMTTAKTIAVFAIIVGCFAVLYPKIFHPMLLNAFGGSPSNAQDNTMPQMPPHLRQPSGNPRGGPSQDDFSQHMRGGPHPGMRAAAEMKKQAGATTGTGKGMMSIVLPMYAVGIVIYLIYTMTKVFGRSNEKPEEKDAVGTHLKDKAAKQPQNQRLLVDDDARGRQQQQQESPRDNRRRQKDLERLLMKADKDKITELEMQQLKQRLLETEAQMSRILQAMETVADKVDTQIPQPTEEEEEAAEPAAGKVGGASERPTKLQTNDTSPDLDSYDFVRHSSGEQSPVMVEDLRTLEQDFKDDIGDEVVEEIQDEEDILADTEDDDDDEIELDYDPSQEEDEQDEQECVKAEEEGVEEIAEDVIIGQKSVEEPANKVEEEHPDLRKRRAMRNQKHKVKRAD